MNLRLSIIILAAGLFMAIWDADQRAIHNRVLASRNTSGKTSAAAVSSVVLSSKSQAVTAPVIPASVPAEGILLPPVEEAIPLPANLATGTWTGLSDDGRRSVITVHEAPAEAEKHFCIVHSATGRRWCFVRSADERTALEKAPSLR
jgi:hypothetical protein